MDPFADLDDEELLARTPRDPEAFAAFYRRHERGMLVYLLRRTATADIAADLAAEVFAAALMGAPRFRRRTTPAVAWLFGIAKNKLAASYERGRVEERARRRLGAEPLLLTDDALNRVEDLADSAADSGGLTALLESLPTAQREAVRAHVIDDLDYSELAIELECSQAVVRQRVSRGLRTIRSRLEEEAR